MESNGMMPTTMVFMPFEDELSRLADELDNELDEVHKNAGSEYPSALPPPNDAAEKLPRASASNDEEAVRRRTVAETEHANHIDPWVLARELAPKPYTQVNEKEGDLLEPVLKALVHPVTTQAATAATEAVRGERVASEAFERRLAEELSRR